MFALVTIILLLAVVGLLGGSSRYDAIQNIALRPLVALCLIPAIYYLSKEALEKAKPLVMMFFLLGLWMVVQLIPLPSAVWQLMPGREGIAEIDRLVGLEDAWRPISLVPSRGWNAVISLIVPAAALLVGLTMQITARQYLILIAGLALVDALVGLLQVSLGGAGAFYFYQITNTGSPVGLFANENHSAVFSVVALLIFSRLALTSVDFKEPPYARLFYALAYLLVLFAVLISGSRAGLAASALALAATAAMAWLRAQQVAQRRKRRGSRSSASPSQVSVISPSPRTLLFAFAGSSAALLAAFFFLESSPGMTAFIGQNAMEDLRWQIWPVIEGMVAKFWLLGIGFGAFHEVYFTLEPTNLLAPAYINQAHNDWVQLVIEGGIPAIAIFIAFAVWVWRAVVALLTSSSALFQLCFWLPIGIVIAAASAVDYPLRTPIFQLTFVWLLLVLKQDGVRR